MPANEQPLTPLIIGLMTLYPDLRFGQECDLSPDLGTIAAWSKTDEEGNPVPQPTPQQLAAAVAQHEARQAAIAAISAQQAAGFDTGLGFALAMGEHDIQAFTQMTVLVSVALNSGAIAADSPQTFADKNGVLRTLPAQQFIALMLGYGVACKALWQAKKDAGL